MDLIDIYRKLSEKDKKLAEAGLETGRFLGGILTDLGDMIMDSFGIPKDETEKYKPGTKEYREAFCRDGGWNLLWGFVEGKISKEHLVKELKEGWKR